MADGLRLAKTESEYCLLLQDKDGVLAGMVAFELRLSPGEREIHCSDPEFEAGSASLYVSVSDLYILRAFRGRGASYAACQAISHVVLGEVEHIGEQVHKTMSALAQRFKVEVVLSSDMFSHTAQIVDSRLLDLVAGDLELRKDTADPKSSFHAIELLSIASESSR